MTHCPGCGQPADGDHQRCAQLLALDPPRYCEVCGFRLDVQVFPAGFTTSCRECRRRARTPRTPHSRTPTPPNELG